MEECIKIFIWINLVLGKNTFTKHVYFVLNEILICYKNGGSSCWVASLDCAIAFDRLWRDGLAHKQDSGLFLAPYYKCSKGSFRNSLARYPINLILIKVHNIENISLVYWKLKFSFIKKFKKHLVNLLIFDLLSSHYKKNKCND